MTQTIAITGATGFAGGHAVAELLRRGHRVRALVRNPLASKLPAAVDVVAGDLHDLEALDRLMAGADAVVHLAGAISAVKAHDYFRVNAHGTIAVVEAAARAGVPRFVHVSSLAARQPELSSYGASKRAGEDAVVKLTAQLNAVILRPPAVYGPGDRATLPLLKALTQSVAIIPSSAQSRFSLIHVSDLARIVADAAMSDVTGLHEISDGTREGYSWSDLLAIAAVERGGSVRPVFLPRAVPLAVAFVAEALARFTGKPGMVSRDKVAELYHADWVARSGGIALPDPITFTRGFPDTLAWYREAGWLPRGRGADRSAAEPMEKTRS